MGPQRAAKTFAAQHPNAVAFEVTLYGSLAATGKGHMTDRAIIDVLKPIAPVTIVWKPTEVLPFHPNGMLFKAWEAPISSPRKVGSPAGEEDFPADEARPASSQMGENADRVGEQLYENSASALQPPRTDGLTATSWTVYSVGGGALSEGKGDKDMFRDEQVYPLTTLREIQQWCEHNGCGYWEYVDECEDDGIWDYLREVWQAMQASVERGIDCEGALPGPLGLARKAPTYHVKARAYKPALQSRGLVYAYALAVSEENASGGTIVTAPTCGASGVVPAVLYHLAKGHDFSEAKILHALATAGIFGNVVKCNASISGAEVGCQGEVGVACAMASAASCQLFGGSPSQIEYAAEMGLEHHLGMTCDPVCGLVQIPCIERNAFAACRALDAQLYATFSDGRHRVSFDHVVEVMKQTGHDLPSLYKETSEGGLAKEMTEEAD